jgi:2-amino-4-hydroxy-6-hydroxymethyldihydropteridine diphosphokinase
MASARAYVGLGSNLGDRQRALERALELLAQRGFAPAARSALYWTEPVGGPPQDWFLNAVAAGDTRLAPEELLEACLATERDLGRVRGERNGPRTLDADLLLYGAEVRDGQSLTLPHPRLHERRFVLVPLCEIAPQAVHPVLHLTAAELLARCSDRSQVLDHPPVGSARA